MCCNRRHLARWPARRGQHGPAWLVSAATGAAIPCLTAALDGPCASVVAAGTPPSPAVPIPQTLQPLGCAPVAEPPPPAQCGGARRRRQACPMLQAALPLRLLCKGEAGRVLGARGQQRVGGSGCGLAAVELGRSVRAEAVPDSCLLRIDQAYTPPPRLISRSREERRNSACGQHFRSPVPAPLTYRSSSSPGLSFCECRRRRLAANPATQGTQPPASLCEHESWRRARHE